MVVFVCAWSYRIALAIWEGAMRVYLPMAVRARICVFVCMHYYPSASLRPHSHYRAKCWF